MRLNKPAAMKEQEAQAYVQYLEDKYHKKVSTLDITWDDADPDYVGLNYTFESIPFERIRRITGYLVGTMDHWNNAKASEEADRVKHKVAGAGLETL